MSESVVHKIKFVRKKEDKYLKHALELSSCETLKTFPIQQVPHFLSRDSPVLDSNLGFVQGVDSNVALLSNFSFPLRSELRSGWRLLDIITLLHLQYNAGATFATKPIPLQVFLNPVPIQHRCLSQSLLQSRFQARCCSQSFLFAVVLFAVMRSKRACGPPEYNRIENGGTAAHGHSCLQRIHVALPVEREVVGDGGRIFRNDEHSVGGCPENQNARTCRPRSSHVSAPSRSSPVTWDIYMRIDLNYTEQTRVSGAVDRCRSSRDIKGMCGG
ncbi:hypothetical protein EVAR_29564_1 [Eumeta japonica]|uniref:Uncharacterized protein n=1 Tax=Eumeta variegata TaxID=151549 RepID=A0A4C1SK23_EUMVA|nr:hypothetical protein EVAR_29564_1 [Eumeta japonica]